MSEQLFVLVSTGQNVANLPPVLEWAQPGDKVLWLESSQARNGNWKNGAAAVLKRHGLTDFGPAIAIEEVNDPFQVVRACAPIAEKVKDRLRPVLVANGGNKLAPLGLLLAWQALRPAILHGNDRRAELWAFANGLDQPPSIQPYTRHTLDLYDVLETSGHVVKNRDSARRIWPAATPLDEWSSDVGYAIDHAYTGRLHEQHALWAAAEHPDRELGLNFTEVGTACSPERLAKWKRAFASLLQAAHRWRPSSEHPGRPSSQQLMAQLAGHAGWQEVYQATCKLQHDASVALRRGNLVPPAESLGRTFLRAVAKRLWQWLEIQKGAACVQSLWMNVEASRQEAREHAHAQFDLLLVLKNGILLHLECKAAAETASKKELDARLLNLQQTGSQLARMAVCAPVFTSFANQPWFEMYHEMKQRIDAFRHIGFVPFTLAGQPTTYQLPASGGSSQFRCQPFEEALAQFIAAYRPTDQGGVEATVET